jgi:hypothetical protein
MKEMQNEKIEGLCDLSELDVVVVKYDKREKETKEELLDNWKEKVFYYSVVDRKGYEVLMWLKRYYGMELLNVYEGILENERELMKRYGIYADMVVCAYKGEVYNYGNLFKKNRKWLFEVVRWFGVEIEKDGYELSWRNFSREEMIEMIVYVWREKEVR